MSKNPIIGESVGLSVAVQGIEDDDVKERHGGQSLNVIKSDSAMVVDNNHVKNKRPSCDVTAQQEDQKRKKTRRARKARANKRKPYNKLSWKEKGGLKNKEREDDNERAKMFSYGLPEAPYNTTQFLMEDHNDVQDLDVKLQAATTNTEGQSVGIAIFQKPRARDSSFSMDSEDDYFYSSPSDEEEFLTREFANTYQDLHAERLGALSKSQLIQDYLQLEGKVDLLEKRLKKIKEQSSSNSDADGVEEDSINAEKKKDLDVQQQMDLLVLENERLASENERLRLLCTKQPSVSSVDSESDSTDSTCSSSSDSEDNAEVKTTNGVTDIRQ